MKTLYIVGGSSTALEIREVANLYYSEKYERMFNVVADGESCVYSFIEDSQLIASIHESGEVYFIIGFTNVALKQKYIALFMNNGGTPANIIHPDTFIAPSAKIGRGNFITCQCIISTQATIGEHNIINYQVMIGHDAIIGNNCTLNPGCKLSGHVKLGDNCMVGSNSFILQGVKVGSDIKIDAMTYINRDIEESASYSSNFGFKKYKNQQ